MALPESKGRTSFASAFSSYLRSKGSSLRPQPRPPQPPEPQEDSSEQPETHLREDLSPSPPASEHQVGDELYPPRPEVNCYNFSFLPPWRGHRGPYNVMAHAVSRGEGIVVLTWSFNWDGQGLEGRLFEVVQLSCEPLRVVDGPTSWRCGRAPLRIVRPPGHRYTFAVHAVIEHGDSSWQSPSSVAVVADLRASAILAAGSKNRPQAAVADSPAGSPMGSPLRRLSSSSLSDDTLQRLSLALRTFEISAGVGPLQEASPLSGRAPGSLDEASPRSDASSHSAEVPEDAAEHLESWIKSTLRRMQEQMQRMHSIGEMSRASSDSKDVSHD